MAYPIEAYHGGSVARLEPPRKVGLMTGIAAAALLLPTLTVHAQETADPDVLGRTAGPDAPAGEDSELIQVTGSRIVRSGVTAPTPLTQLNSDEIGYTGETSILSILDDLPSVGTGLGVGNSTTLPNASGLQSVNLRNLGIDRTLVLVNGRRFVPFPIATTQQVAVDLGNIPTSIIDRVETITGGASAVYGSDAIAGVVNIILKEDFEGLALDAQAGISDEGDAEELRFSATFGKQFADDQLSFLFSVEYSEIEEIVASDREVDAPGFIGLPEGAPFFPFVGVGGSNLDPETGLISVVPSIVFGPDGAPRPGFAGGAPLGTMTFNPATGAFDPSLPNVNGLNPLPFVFGQIPLERLVLNGNVKYDITPSVTFFLEGSYSDVQSTRQIVGSLLPADFVVPIAPTDPVTGLVGPTGNPFLPTVLQDAIDAQAALIASGAADPASLPAFIGFQRAFTDVGPQRGDIDRETFRVASGFEGEFEALGGPWRWDVFASFGRVTSSNIATNSLNLETLTIALSQETCDAFNDLTAINTDSPGCPGVIDLFPDTPAEIGNSITPELVDFIAPPLQRFTEYEQLVVGGTVTGDVVDLPAGPLSAAFGVEYRDEELLDIPDQLVQNGLSTLNFTEISEGGFDVFEVFGETSIPLVSNVPFVDYLEITGALRYFDFSTLEDGDIAYKVGGTWDVNESLRLRASFDAAFRAPNLPELVTGELTSFPLLTDPCTGVNAGSDPVVLENCQAAGVPLGFFQPTTALPIAVSGNPNLKQEEADTLTVGAVITPTVVPGLTVSIDYFDIEVEDAIIALTAGDILNGCFTTPGAVAGGNPLCGLVERLPSGEIEDVFTSQINSGVVSTAGIDFEVNYSFDLAELPFLDNGRDFGALDLRWIGTYLREFEIQAFDGSPVILSDGSTVDLPPGPITLADGTITQFEDTINGLGFPTLSWNFRATYTYRRLTASFFVRYIGSLLADTLTEDPVTGAVSSGIEAFPGLGGLPATAFEEGDLEPEVYLDMTVNYALTDGLTIRGGVNNATDNTPPVILPPLGARSAGTNTNRGIYDYRGRFFFIGLNARF